MSNERLTWQQVALGIGFALGAGTGIGILGTKVIEAGGVKPFLQDTFPAGFPQDTPTPLPYSSPTPGEATQSATATDSLSLFPTSTAQELATSTIEAPTQTPEPTSTLEIPLDPLKITDILKYPEREPFQEMILRIPITRNGETRIIEVHSLPAVNNDTNRDDFAHYREPFMLISPDKTGNNLWGQVHSGSHNQSPLPYEDVRHDLQGNFILDDGTEIPEKLVAYREATGVTFEQNGLVWPVSIVAVGVVGQEMVTIPEGGTPVHAVDYLREEPLEGQTEASVSDYAKKLETIFKAQGIDNPFAILLEPDSHRLSIVTSLWGLGTDPWSSEVLIITLELQQ